MDLLANLATGFQVALTPANLLYCFIGTLAGTAIGVLPGIGPLATIAMLLPITTALPPVSALIMLAGIYYGAQYGGSTTAILLNLPGEASSAVTTLDGYQMARQGRAGAALAAAALSSFFAGTFATLVIALFAVPLTGVALRFGPPEYFSLMVLGLVASVVLARGSVLRAIPMVILGLLLGIVGTDIYSGAARFNFEMIDLADGIDFVAMTVGLFGISEILRNLENEDTRDAIVRKVKGLWLTGSDLRRILPSTLRGTLIGSCLGVLPGGGALLSSFAAYMIEKRVSPNGAELGRGAIEGVAAPESANNAGAQTSFIPMLTLGLPSNAVMAMMIGAMIIQGIAPGPGVVTQKPDLFWGLICSMWVGNLMLVLLNLPLIGLWVKMLSVPYQAMFPAIVIFSMVGVYSTENSSFALFELAAFGAFGYLLSKLDFEPTPLILGFVLGPTMEEQMRRALIMSRGDATVFLTEPISLAFLVAAAAALVVACLPASVKKRQEAFNEE